jgi:hypothetical protein
VRVERYVSQTFFPTFFHPDGHAFFPAFDSGCMEGIPLTAAALQY